MQINIFGNLFEDVEIPLRQIQNKVSSSPTEFKRAPA